MSKPIILPDIHFQCPRSFSFNCEERLPFPLGLAAIATLIPPIYSKLSSRGVFLVRTFAAASLLGRLASYAIGYMVHPATTYNKNSAQIQLGAQKVPQQRLAAEMYQRSQMVFSSKRVGASWQRLKLESNGVIYDALSIKRAGFKADNANELWTLKTYGNGDFYEAHISEGDKFGEENTLFLNGPGVYESTGRPCRAHWGGAVDAALHYLEGPQKAKKIVMHGHSLGAGLVGEGVLRHQLKSDVKYLFVADRTFSQLSWAAGGVLGLGEKIQWALFIILKFLGVELNTQAGIEKTLREGHKVVVISSSDERGDGVIPANSYPEVTDGSGITHITGNDIDHNGDLPQRVERALANAIQDFEGKVASKL